MNLTKDQTRNVGPADSPDKKMTTYTEAFTTQRKKELQAITPKEARDFLLQHGYASIAAILPEYYQPANLDKINLKPLNWKNSKTCKVTKPLKLITPKGKLSWRNFDLVHPYIYLHKVDTITNAKNWQRIVGLICKETCVNSYSIPVLKLKDEKIAASGIKSWIQLAEKDIIKDSGNYNFLTVTDIQNFYESIYTHSIAWVIETKAIAKEPLNRIDLKMLGNQLDKLFMNSKDGQTNGIPTGVLTSDLIAEIILTDVDEKMSCKLKAEGLEKRVLIARYSDDYRILSKNESDGQLVVSLLSEVLRKEYDLHLNAEKTKQYTDVIEGSFRSWLIDIKSSIILRPLYRGNISNCQSGVDLKEALLELYRVQRKYPSRKVSLTILSKLSSAYSKHPESLKLKESDIPELVSILRSLTLLRGDSTPAAYSLLNIILSKAKSQEEKVHLLKSIKHLLINGVDREYQIIWYHRLCWAISPEECEEITSNNNFALLNLLKEATPHYNAFGDCDLELADSKSLEAFVIVDMSVYAACKGQDINPKIGNPFY